MIFETKNLLVRKLKLTDIDGFFKLESNPKVLQFALGNPKNFEECKTELSELISKYDVIDNDFWIYTIERKSDTQFIGTLALVKDGEDDEIGYRFIEDFWGNSYGFEICGGLILYCKINGMKKIIGYVVDKNIASAKILERYHFKKVSTFISDDIGLPETKYELIL